MPQVTVTGARHADAIENALTAEKRAIPAGLNAVAEPIQTYLEVKVDIPFPPASEPGQPAHRRSGKYKRNWHVKARGLTLTIRNPVKYAGFLEFGTRKMKARPALTKSGFGARALVRTAGRTAADTARRLPLPRARG